MEEQYMEYSRKQWEKRAVQWKKEDDYRQQLEKLVFLKNGIRFNYTVLSSSSFTGVILRIYRQI